MTVYQLFRNRDFEINFDFGEWINKHTNKNYMFPEKKIKYEQYLFYFYLSPISRMS